jgi:periplasmic protein TonB
MFETLVVSTAQRRRGRTAKFFVCTSIIYLSAVAVGLALSVLLATPNLADTGTTSLVPIIHLTGGGRQKPLDERQPNVASRKDLRNVESLDKLMTNLANPRLVVFQNPIPQGTIIDGGLESPGDGGPGLPGMPASAGLSLGPGNVLRDPPKPPDVPKPQRKTMDNPKPLPVSSTVLQGKAIERVVPVYPELPKRIGLKGDVSVEVIISPEGRVESVRVVNGHPMLVNSALEAARRWRFEPTLLNGVPVRVTGVITFVFKLNE